MRAVNLRKYNMIVKAQPLNIPMLEGVHSTPRSFYGVMCLTIYIKLGHTEYIEYIK